MKRDIVGLALGLCLAIPLVAIAVERTEQESEKRHEIRKLLELTGAGKMGIQAMNQMIESMKKATPSVPEEFWKRFAAKAKPETLVDLLVPIYDKHLTLEDVQALNEFWKSPVGKRFVAVQPMIMQESMAAGQVWGRELGKEALAALKEEGFKP